MKTLANLGGDKIPELCPRGPTYKGHCLQVLLPSCHPQSSCDVSVSLSTIASGGNCREKLQRLASLLHNFAPVPYNHAEQPRPPTQLTSPSSLRQSPTSPGSCSPRDLTQPSQRDISIT